MIKFVSQKSYFLTKMRPQNMDQKTQRKKIKRLTKIKNKFSLLKDKMPNTILEEASPSPPGKKI